MIVVIEGVDGTGKSTVCRLLATRLNAGYYATPPEEYRNMRTLVDKEASAEAHYRFFLQGVCLASNELRDLQQRGMRVVVDRYWMTTVAYHRAMGIDATLKDFGVILLPDFTVYLEVTPQVQQERLQRRGLTSGDLRTLQIQNRVREEYALLLEGCSNVLRIDTTKPTPEEVVDLILAALKPV